MSKVPLSDDGLFVSSGSQYASELTSRKHNQPAKEEMQKRRMDDFDPVWVMSLKANPKITSHQRERPRPAKPNPLAKRDRNIIKINAEAVKAKGNKTQNINKDLLKEMKTDKFGGIETTCISTGTLHSKHYSRTGLNSKATWTRDAASGVGITNLQVERESTAAFANETVSNKLRKSNEMENSQESLDQVGGRTADHADLQ